MSQSTVTYGGFTFPLNRLRVTESPVFSDDGVTLEGTMYTFSVDGLINAGTQADFATLLTSMRCQLRMPQQAFSITWAPTSGSPATYWSFGGSDAPDNAWGPHPGDLTLARFSGGLAAIYGWSVSCFRKECYGDSCMLASQLYSQVLSINRSYSFSVDANGFTTRTITGRLVCTQQGAPADQYRYVVEPDLPANFKRESRQYSQSEDGRTLNFTIVDVEQLYTLPTPITNGSATYRVSINNGLLVNLSLFGYYEASKSTPKSTILSCIATLAINKFQLSSQNVLPLSMDLSTDVYKNRIDFNIQVQAAGGNSTPDPTAWFSNFQQNTQQLVANPPNSNGVAFITGVFGGDANANSGVIGAVPVVYDACSMTPTQNPSSIGTGTSGSTPPGGALTESAGPNNNTGVSSDHLNNPYQAYLEKFNYAYDSGIIVLYPKQKGSDPIYQQTRNPRMIVTIAGYMKKCVKSTGAPPSAPDPFDELSSQNYTLMLSDIEPASAEPVGDGSWNLWTLHWRYVLHYDVALTNDDGAPMYFPGDHRRSNSAPIAFPTSSQPTVVTTPDDLAD
jgi:hypothetical protein